MNYDICVSLHGKYYFNANPRNTSREQAMAIYHDLANRFPPDQGFKVELTEWTIPVGRGLASTEALA